MGQKQTTPPTRVSSKKKKKQSQYPGKHDISLNIITIHWPEPHYSSRSLNFGFSIHGVAWEKAASLFHPFPSS